MSPKILTDLKQEVTQLLSELIRIDTTNPPGNETKAANYIAQYLINEGFKVICIDNFDTFYDPAGCSDYPAICRESYG